MSAISQLGPHLKREVLVSGISNTFFNGLIAWLLLRTGANLTLGGEHSYIGDVLATAFILPFIVTLIVIPLNRRKLAKGDATAVNYASDHWLDRVLARFPEALGWRATWVGLCCVLLIGPVTLFPLWALGLHEFTPLAYSMFKGVWAGLLAALITPVLLMLALGEE